MVIVLTVEHVGRTVLESLSGVVLGATMRRGWCSASRTGRPGPGRRGEYGTGTRAPRIIRFSSATECRQLDDGYFGFGAEVARARAGLATAGRGWNSLCPACQRANAKRLAKSRKPTFFSSVKCPLS